MAANSGSNTWIPATRAKDSQLKDVFLSSFFDSSFQNEQTHAYILSGEKVIVELQLYFKHFINLPTG